MGVMMLTRRRLLFAGRASSHHRTVWRPTGNIGPRGEAARARRQNLRQESKQENWQDQFKPAP
jgi:hypothetical protein